MIADKAHKFQLNANLLYTAVTRAKKMLVILTQAETLNYAMSLLVSKSLASSSLDIKLCAKLLSRLSNPNVRVLFVVL